MKLNKAHFNKPSDAFGSEAIRLRSTYKSHDYSQHCALSCVIYLISSIPKLWLCLLLNLPLNGSARKLWLEE